MNQTNSLSFICNSRPSSISTLRVEPFKHKIFYISPRGSDENPGTINSPLRTLARALYVVAPGDIIFLRNGIYDIDVEINVSGEPNNPITIQSYPGERAIFDGSKYAPYKSAKFRITGSWLVIRGIEVRNGPSDGILLTEGAGFNLLDNVISHNNYFTGIELENGAHNNTILNCDSYRNFDYGPTKGEHADGFGARFNVGPGNKFIGCRAWENSDDGFDLWEAKSQVVIERSWAWRNGHDLWGVGEGFSGDGNGFKLGPGSPLIHHCISWENARNGFDFNDATETIYCYNNTSFKNGRYGFKFTLGNHILKNNLSFLDPSNLIGTACLQEKNSWNLKKDLSINKDLFKSLDKTTCIGPRKKGGELPYCDFLKPKPGSPLIDEGVDVGLSYYGNAPDLGAQEYPVRCSK